MVSLLLKNLIDLQNQIHPTANTNTSELQNQHRPVTNTTRLQNQQKLLQIQLDYKTNNDLI